jgi:hypothetical protein
MRRKRAEGIKETKREAVSNLENNMLEGMKV